MNVDELSALVERARAEESLTTRPPADLLVRARGAVRGRRRRIAGAVTAGTLAAVAVVVSGVVLAHGGPGSGRSAVEPREARTGDAATWTVEDPQDLSASSESFTALVERVGCNGGETGEVYPPEISYQAAQIVVTFSVAPLKPGVDYTCQGNTGEPYPVRLAEPINGRDLVDGACQPGQPTAGFAACTFVNPVRWTPAAGARPDRCDGTTAELTQEGSSPVSVFPASGSGTFSAGRPIEWSKEGPCAAQVSYTLDSASGSSFLDQATLNLEPGWHSIVIGIPMCASQPDRTRSTCRGGLSTVTSRFRVQ